MGLNECDGYYPNSQAKRPSRPVGLKAAPDNPEVRIRIQRSFKKTN